MYITNVIEIAKKLHPSEYSVEEYIRWCDELSAEIMRNYNESYSEKTETGSCVLLPPGIDIDDISKIIMDGKEKKTAPAPATKAKRAFKEGAVSTTASGRVASSAADLSDDEFEKYLKNIMNE